MIPRLASLAVLPLVCGLLAACGGDDSDEVAAELPEGCEEVAEPEAKQVNLRKPRGLSPPAAGTVAVVDTSCGSFGIELDTRSSPRTTASFANLVTEGVYDGTPFHRIVPDFVVQGGDPRGDGTGDPGYFVDEQPPGNVAYTRGTVAMAKTEVEPAGRSGSQFFIVVAADAGLPADFALLGEVGEGMDVVERIAQLGDPASGQSGAPIAPVVIDSITLEQR